MFKIRSGTHDLNEELGINRGTEGRKECLLCDDEGESVSHVWWDCLVYNTLRNDFMCKLLELLGDRFKHFESLDSFEKESFVLGSELRDDDFSSILNLVNSFLDTGTFMHQAHLCTFMHHAVVACYIFCTLLVLAS